MDHIELYALRPVNKTAGIVASQRGCNVADSLIKKEELLYLLERLTRKQRLIKKILGVRNKTHHKNIIHRIIGGHINPNNYNIPRLLPEYKRVGEAIEKINRRLSEIKDERRQQRQAAINRIASEMGNQAPAWILEQAGISHSHTQNLGA